MRSKAMILGEKMMMGIIAMRMRSKSIVSFSACLVQQSNRANGITFFDPRVQLI